MSTALVQESEKHFIKEIERDLTAITMRDTKAASPKILLSLHMMYPKYLEYF